MMDPEDLESLVFSLADELDRTNKVVEKLEYSLGKHKKILFKLMSAHIKPYTTAKTINAMYKELEGD